MKSSAFIAAMSSAAMLAGCTGDPDGAAVTPTNAERACLRDVAEETGNPEAVVLGSGSSGSGTSVRIGIGPNRAPWDCTAYRDGSTGGIQSLTDEGYL